MLKYFDDEENKFIRSVKFLDDEEIITSTFIKGSKYDSLILPNINDINIDDLLYIIYNSLIKNNEKRSKRNKLLICFNDFNMTSDILLKLIDSMEDIKRLGYDNFAFNYSTSFTSEMSEYIINTLKEVKLPLYINYQVLSTHPTLRYNLNPHLYGIDVVMKLLYDFNKYIKEDKEYLKNYHSFSRDKNILNISYPISEDINDSAYEIVLLNYYSETYNLKPFIINPNAKVKKLISAFPCLTFNLVDDEISKSKDDIIYKLTI